MRNLGAALVLLAALSARAEERSANMNLILAVDVSGSIGEPDAATNVREFSLMKEGIWTALTDKAVGDALEQCNDRGVAVTIFEWSGTAIATELKDVVPWTLAMNRQSLQTIADQYVSAPRSFKEGGTDVDRSLSRAHQLLDEAPMRADRNVVLVSSDGRQNVYERGNGRNAPKVVVSATRDQLLAQGATIDALVIENDEHDRRSHNDRLSDWYGKNVIGGPGAFVKPIGGFKDYSEGLRALLLRELSRCGS